ncbi:MAG: divalent-cation tolerance protein CutA [Puniceicoccales bacterium]|jgi:periplasmic divalent cation tolerance protein|nr:divalent-cation tolerance protein CutA [Puniceicoccales bacterium]
MDSAKNETAEICIGWTTLPDRQSAERIAGGIVASGLAACAQISDAIESFYCWKGEFCNEREWRVAIKFPRRNAAAVEEWLVKAHPYEVPQWLWCAAAGGLPAYLNWANEIGEA